MPIMSALAPTTAPMSLLDAMVTTSGSPSTAKKPDHGLRGATVDKAGVWHPPFSGGLAGIANIGNTCYLASASQCLAHTPALTEYFLSEGYLKEINEENFLGTKGKLVRAWA